MNTMDRYTKQVMLQFLAWEKGVTVEKYKSMFGKKGDWLVTICDVCSTNSETIKGGAALVDNDGTASLICLDCWINYTNVPSDKRETQNLKYLTASRHNIATDPNNLVELFDPNETFRRSVLKFRARNRKLSKRYDVTGPGKTSFMRKVPKEVPKSEIGSVCAECCIVYPIEQVKTCPLCKSARYCSRECQKDNWKVHKPKCEEWTKIVEEVEKEDSEKEETQTV